MSLPIEGNTGISSSPVVLQAQVKPRARMKHLLATFWQARGFVGGLAAFALAMLGQQAALEKQDEKATILYGLAMVLLIAVLAPPTLKIRSIARRTRRASTAPDNAQAQPQAEPLRTRRVHSGATTKAEWRTLRARLGLRATVAGLTLSLALAAASAWLLAFVGITNPLAGLLWVGSLVVLLLTFVGVEPRTQGPSLLPGPQSDRFWRGVPSIPVRLEVVIVGLILLGALALRLYNLENHPVYFGDEGERGLEGRRINAGEPYNVFGFGWWSVPNLYFYCVAWFLRLFGDNMTGNRLFSVVCGMLIVWFAYRIG